MAKPKQHVCKPKREKTTGTILVKKIGDLDWHSAPVPMQASLAKVRQRAPDYITEEIIPGPKGITTREKCSFTEKGKRLKIRKCDISLQFVGPSATGPMGVPEGAYLRICTKWGANPLMIPVRDHQDAMRKSRKICGCVAEGETSAKCAGKISTVERPTFKRRAAPSKKTIDGDDCLQWSRNGKRCLRRRPKD